MSDQLTRIEEKLDRTQDLVYQLGKSLAAQTAHLEGLGRRVSSAEAELAEVREQQEPLKKHVAMWGGAAKALGVFGAISGVIAGIRQIFQ